MEFFNNPIAIVAIGGVIVILLYQVYYYLLGGKDIDTPFTAENFKQEIKAFQQSIVNLMKEQKQQAKIDAEKLESDLQNGTAYILEPKFFFIPEFIQNLLIVIFLILFLAIAYLCATDLYEMSTKCEQFYGFNSLFVLHVLLFSLFIIYPLIVLNTIISRIAHFVKKYQKNAKVKPYWFSHRTVSDYILEKERKQDDNLLNDVLQCICMFGLFVYLPLTITGITAKDFTSLDIITINQIYNQKCHAKMNEK